MYYIHRTRYLLYSSTSYTSAHYVHFHKCVKERILEYTFSNSLKLAAEILK